MGFHQEIHDFSIVLLKSSEFSPDHLRSDRFGTDIETLQDLPFVEKSMHHSNRNL